MTYTGIILLVLLALGILFLVLVIARSKTRKVHPTAGMSVEYLDQLMQALGTEENIQSASHEHQRIRLVILDLKKVSSATLKSLNIPAFLKGKELTLLVKHHAKDVVRHIQTLKREVN